MHSLLFSFFPDFRIKRQCCSWFRMFCSCCLYCRYHVMKPRCYCSVSSVVWRCCERFAPQARTCSKWRLTSSVTPWDCRTRTWRARSWRRSTEASNLPSPSTRTTSSAYRRCTERRRAAVEAPEARRARRWRRGSPRVRRRRRHCARMRRWTPSSPWTTRTTCSAARTTTNYARTESNQDTPSASLTRGADSRETSTPPSRTATERRTSSRARSTGATWARKWTGNTPSPSARASQESRTTSTPPSSGAATERYTSSKVST